MAHPSAPAVRSRRQFLRDTAIVGATGAVGVWGSSRAASAGSGQTVAILGGGVAGLSAAHELAERGFAVTVYERKELGGKARSIPVPGSATESGAPLPGEHGFRFFPGFYWNLGDTMRRIPFPGNRRGAWDNLVRGTAYMASRSGGRHDITAPFPFPPPPNPSPYTPDSFMETLAGGLSTVFRLPPHEAAYFARKGFVYVTSCDERRLGQWDTVTWSEFVRAEQMSEEYRRLVADGVVRNLAATKSANASTHSIGLVGEATLWSILGRGNEPGGSVDRVLDGPTSARLIDPWVAHLRSLGVEFRVGYQVEELRMSDGRVASATARDPSGRPGTIRADWFLSAMPVERAVELLSAEVLDADPDLASIRQLRTDWMNGLMFYLKRKLPLAPGHVNYVDSPWAVTSISQAQFWERDFRNYGDGTVQDCLSTIISDWVAAGTFNGKRARDCTREEIADEVWAQIKAHLNDTGEVRLSDSMLHSWFLDPAILSPGTPQVANDEPLFIQNAGSWADRPGSKTAIPNLFLAGDWVRTNINVTTMEGANEGARQAVNALLDASGSDAARCGLHDLFRPPEFEVFKDIDRARYRLGQPNLFDTLDPLRP